MNKSLTVRPTKERRVTQEMAKVSRDNAVSVVRNVEMTLREAPAYDNKVSEELFALVSHDATRPYDAAQDEAVQSMVDLILDNRTMPHINGKAVGIAATVWAKAHPSDVSRKQLWNLGAAVYGIFNG